MQSVVWNASRVGQLGLHPMWRQCFSLVGSVSHYATTTAKNPKTKIKDKKNTTKDAINKRKPLESKHQTTQQMINNRTDLKTKRNEPKITTTSKSVATKGKEGTKATTSKAILKTPQTKKASKGKEAQVDKKTKSKPARLAPQVGDIESRGRKELAQAEEVVKGEKVKEVDATGVLIMGDAIEKAGEVVKGDATKLRPQADPSKDVVKHEELSDSDSAEYKDEDEGQSEDAELQGYGEETYDYFTRNVTKLGKTASYLMIYIYSHYVEKIKQFLEQDQQYYAVRLFTFIQQSMPVTPELYEIMMKSYLDKGNFTTAFFYLDQMKGREVTPTEATLEAFISFFALHPNKTNQAKFEATLSSLGLPSRAPTPLHRRRRG